MGCIDIGQIARRLAAEGLKLRGAFHDEGSSDGGLAGARTILVIGNAGSAFWQAFSRHRREEDNPMDRWVRRIVDPLAAECGGRARYPSDGPPYLPMQKLALRAEPGQAMPSPIGLLMHRRYGLWHAYRAVIECPGHWPLPDPPAGDAEMFGCDVCADRPCLHACPVRAFGADGYDVTACRGHVASKKGRPCLTGGCLCRHACPVGQDYAYPPGQAHFHMQSFLGR